MIIDCISDLHGEFPNLEGGDLLIVAGDLTAQDGLKGHSDFLEWLHKQDYKKKVVAAGNHDGFLVNNPNFYSKTDIDYLCDSGTEFEGLRIWGSPWTKSFPKMNPHCMAFTQPSEKLLREHFEKIPNDVDILVTHCPPFGVLDDCIDRERQKIVGFGSLHLRHMMEKIKPKLHIFGHLHLCGGQKTLFKHEGPNTWCVNAAIMDEDYEPSHKPVRIIL